MKILILILYLSSPVCLSGQTASEWSNLKHGPSKVGYRKIKETSIDGQPISLWYPAGDGGKIMTFRDYIVAGKIHGETPDSLLIQEFRGPFAFMYRDIEIESAEFNAIIDTKTVSYRDASMKDALYPVIIAYSDPVSFFPTFEFLASHGFIVASIPDIYTEPISDSTIYKPSTLRLQKFVKYCSEQNYLRNDEIYAFGFGGGIQAPFYLAMKDVRIKKIINVDGGVFGPRSKTNISNDYYPEKLKAPLLHLITTRQAKDDDENQFNALQNLRYQVIVKSPQVRHHDFTAWGRVIIALNKRGEDTLSVNRVFDASHRLLLGFLCQDLISEKDVDSSLFTYRKFVGTRSAHLK